MTRANGVIETVDCSCIAGLGKSCCHAVAIIRKVGIIDGKCGDWVMGLCFALIQSNIHPLDLTEDG